MNQPCALYRHFDASGRLLYVGISISALARQIAHRAEAHWWEDVASITIARFPSVAEAEHAERIAIATEDPVHNTIRRKPRVEPAFEPQTPLPSFDVSDDMSEMKMQEMRDQAYAAGRARGAEIAAEERRQAEVARRARAASRFASAVECAR